MLHDLGDETICSSYHYIYVPKTDAEMGEIKEYVEKLSILSGPEALGGVAIPESEVSPLSSEMIGRMVARIQVAPKMKWGIEIYD